MSQYPYPPSSHRPMEVGYQSGVTSTSVAQFFNAVYAWMSVGLATTALVAWWVASKPELIHSIFSGGTYFILVIAELALVVAISGAINKINTTIATLLFVLFSALNGLTLSVLFVIYTQASLTSAFIVTAGTFAAVSLYGFVTKRDLTRMGSFLFMALIGLIIASVVNMFFASSTLYWITTYAGVLIFVGLTAYDTQKLRAIAIQTENNPAMAARLSVSGALSLYLDFINLFIYMLRIMGSRKS